MGGENGWSKRLVAMGREKPYKNRPFTPVLTVGSKPEPPVAWGA